jgi:hypothetical protein
LNRLGPLADWVIWCARKVLRLVTECFDCDLDCFGDIDGTSGKDSVGTPRPVQQLFRHLCGPYELVRPDHFALFFRRSSLVTVAVMLLVVTLRAMLRDGTLRSGSAVEVLARTAHRIVVADPRLVDDARSTEMPDPVAVTEGQWQSYWRRWPLAAWAGELKGQPGRWFSIIDGRFNPNFTIEERLASTFDVMVGELIEFRLARHLLGKATRRSGEFVCKLGHADGRPLVWLDRERYPQMPEARPSLWQATAFTSATLSRSPSTSHPQRDTRETRCTPSSGRGSVLRLAIPVPLTKFSFGGSVTTGS